MRTTFITSPSTGSFIFYLYGTHGTRYHDVLPKKSFRLASAANSEYNTAGEAGEAFHLSFFA